jgi:hypothetical protein
VTMGNSIDIYLHLDHIYRDANGEVWDCDDPDCPINQSDSE